MTTTQRDIVTATIKAAYPAAATADIREFLDHVEGLSPRTLAASTPGVTTADKVPAPAPKPAATLVAGEGERLVEVTDAVERTFDDTGVVLILTLRDAGNPDAEPIKTRFDAKAATRRKIAMAAMGLADGAAPADMIGRQAVVEVGPFTGRDGVERLGVNKWVTKAAMEKRTAPPATKGPSVVAGIGNRRTKPAPADDGDTGF